MVTDQLAFVHNLFYPTNEGAKEEDRGSEYVDNSYDNDSDIIDKRLFQQYNISSFTRKVLLLPLICWYLLWQLSAVIPADYRPIINVDKLNEYDRYLFTILPHQVISVIHCDYLDVLMAIPYTLHVVLPVTFSLWALKDSIHLLLPFGNCFGLVSFAAVVTEILLPCAPPWYFEKYGVSPATYDLPGDPGGLERVDKLFGISFYNNTFSKSPLVFGAFPSLHVAWPVLLALFMWYHVSAKWYARLPVAIYVVWVCTAVVYLHHHYVVDVIGGIAYSWLAYHFVGPHLDEKPKNLKNIQPAANVQLAGSGSN